MTADELRDQVLRFDIDAPIEGAWTVPASWYTEPAFARLEQRAVFAKSWHFVAAAEQLATPGSFVAGRDGGFPWVVLRDRQGALRGLHNVCRHKAAEVAVGCGVTERLSCPYHGWTYDLDGRLRTAPRTGGIRAFDRSEMSLRPLAVEQLGPFIFAHPDPNAAPLAPALTELTRRLAASGWERARYLGCRTWDVACNWKVFADNYLDGGYHISVLHPSLDAQLDMSAYRTELFDRYSIQSSPAATEDDARIDFDAQRRIGAGAIYAWVYPNLAINRYGPVLDTNRVVPVGADRCRVIFDFWFDEGTDQAFIDRSQEQTALTQDEDVRISESVQVGLASGSYDRGRFAPSVEMGVHHFQRLIAADLRKAVEREGGVAPAVWADTE